MGFLKLITFLFTLLFIPAVVAAESMYVSDQLIITLRRGKSTEHKILKTLQTGTHLEILDREEGDEYVRVKTQDGEEGYVLAQYLTDETPKPIIIARLGKKIEQINKQLAQAEAKRDEISKKLKDFHNIQSVKENEHTGTINELRQTLNKTKEELQIITAKYKSLEENSGRVVEITDEIDRLQKDNVKLSAEVQVLSNENNDLKRSGVIKWFLAGAGVLFFGWILGKSSQKKRGGLY